MALILSVIFILLSLFYMETANGFMSAIFLVLSLIAFINYTGGGRGPDRYA